MDQLREHARLMESGVGVYQLVKVRDKSTFSSVSGHLWLDQLTTPLSLICSCRLRLSNIHS